MSQHLSRSIRLPSVGGLTRLCPRAALVSRHASPLLVFSSADRVTLRPSQASVAAYSIKVADEKAQSAEKLQEDPSGIGYEALKKRLEDSWASEPLEGIERELDNKDLRPDAPWGLAVYRTCYDDEAAWQKMRAHLETRFKESIAMRRHASPAQVRDHFEQWARAELEENWAEQPVTDTMRTQIFGTSSGTPIGQDLFSGTRYNVCVVVDDVSLESLSRPRLPLPLVMLVRKQWEPPIDGEEVYDEDHVHPELEEGWMIDQSEGPNGWIYVSACEYLDLYNALSDCNEWQDTFMYPSWIYSQMCLERSPGFWRKERVKKRSN